MVGVPQLACQFHSLRNSRERAGMVIELRVSWEKSNREHFKKSKWSIY